MYAIIQTGGKQYRVSEGMTLKVEKLGEAEVGKTIKLDQVLMLGDGNDSTIGTPLVPKAVVEAEVLAQGKDKKILVYKKKRRKVYERLRGHRQLHTALKIVKIKLS
jgi:large subunit ribosomal protein L21